MEIELIVLQYLISANIPGIGDKVYLEVPESPPDKYLIIEKTGSGEQNHIQQAMLAVQSISSHSLLESLTINSAVKEAMAHMAEVSTDIYSCRLNSDYNHTNVTTKEYRYQAVFNITY